MSGRGRTPCHVPQLRAYAGEPHGVLTDLRGVARLEEHRREGEEVVRVGLVGLLVRRLRALDERRAIEQQRWVESPPPMLQATGLAGRPLSSSLAVSSDGGGAVATSPPATGGMPEEAAAPPEIESFDQLAAQLSLTLNLRDEQAAMLRGHAREIKAAIAESARERRSLPWDEDAALGAAGGLGGARDVLQALEQLGRQVDVLDTWVREAQDTHQQLRRAIALRAPPDLLEGEDVYTEPVDARLLHPTLRATRPSQQV